METKQYYISIGNEQGDSFGVGRIYDKQGWIDQLNDYQYQDERETPYTVESWEGLDEFDFRGIILEPVETTEKGLEYLRYVLDNFS